MQHIKIVPGITKLKFRYTDKKGQKTEREGLVIKMGKGSQYTYIDMDDQLRKAPRRFSVNRMENVFHVTY